MTNETATPWADKVRTLEAAGYSLTSIAELCGLTLQAVSDIKYGRSIEPKGMAAVKLHKLHTQNKRRNANAPR